MLRFYFSLHDGRSPPDPEGAVLPDLESAQLEAVRRVGTLLFQRPQEFWQDNAWALHVTDDAGLPLFTLTVSASWELGKAEGGIGA